MSKHQQRRDEITATFELYGWRPMSKLNSSRRPYATKSVLATLDGKTMRIEKGVVIYNGSKPEANAANLRRLKQREPREWRNLTLPALEMLLTRLKQRLAKECGESGNEQI